MTIQVQAGRGISFNRKSSSREQCCMLKRLLRAPPYKPPQPSCCSWRLRRRCDSLLGGFQLRIVDGATHGRPRSIIRRQRDLGRFDVHGIRGKRDRCDCLALAFVHRCSTLGDSIPFDVDISISISITVSHMDVSPLISNHTTPLTTVLTPRPAPTLTPTPTPATAPTTLLDKPHRLLKHKKIPLKPLSPVLHIPQLLDPPAPLIKHPQQPVVLLAQRAQRGRDVAFLPLDGALAGVQQARARAKLRVQRVAQAGHERRARLGDLRLLGRRRELRRVRGGWWCGMLVARRRGELGCRYGRGGCGGRRAAAAAPDGARPGASARGEGALGGGGCGGVCHRGRLGRGRAGGSGRGGHCSFWVCLPLRPEMLLRKNEDVTRKSEVCINGSYAMAERYGGVNGQGSAAS